MSRFLDIFISKTKKREVCIESIAVITKLLSMNPPPELAKVSAEKLVKLINEL